MNIKEISGVKLKQQIASNILNSLPNWFSIQEAVDEYIDGVRDTVFFACYVNGDYVGFIALKKHFDKSYEVYVMGVKSEYHNQGIGSILLESSEQKITSLGDVFLQVKTLSASRLDKHYDLTRAFYLKNGFVPLEEFKELWDVSNPCLLMIKKLSGPC